MTRLVIDASVLVSTAVAFPGSPSAKLLDAVRSGRVEMVACDHLLTEVDRALQGRYFATRLTDGERASVSALLRAIAVILPNPVSPPRVVRDPGDDYLVALAAQASAEAIVTGDKDLLEHEGLEPVAITAREACARLGLK